MSAKHEYSNTSKPSRPYNIEKKCAQYAVRRAPADQDDPNHAKDNRIKRSIKDSAVARKQVEKPLDSIKDVQGLANEIRKLKSLQPEQDNKNKALGNSEMESVTRPKGSAGLQLDIPEMFSDAEDYNFDDASVRQTTQSPVISRNKRSNIAITRDREDRCHRGRYALGPDPDFQLDLQHADEVLRNSYDLTESGTLDAISFQIRQDGISWHPVHHRQAVQEFDTPSDTIMSYNSKKLFVKLGVLGRGASGVVHKAIHLPSFRLVAMKVIPVYEHDKRQQLISEIKTLYHNLGTFSCGRNIDESQTLAPCPEILCFFDAFMNPNEGTVSIIVEYMDGGSLQDIVDSGGCKSERVLANIALRVLKGLAFLHSRHQLHRDIKPSNLLINHDGDVKISDFGIVREMESSLAMARTFVGTPTYMSPERIGSEEYSYKSDVWSLGLSLMACALGRYPYSFTKGYWELLHLIKNELPPQLPSQHFSCSFRDFLARCLEKNQEERWSVNDLLQHDFLAQYCSQQYDTSPLNGKESDDDTQYGHLPERNSEDHAEIREMAEKVTAAYFKTARKLSHFLFNVTLKFVAKYKKK